MSVRSTGTRAIRRRSIVGAVSVFLIGAALLSGFTAHGIGALCNGRPASSPHFDASGNTGPALLEGTNRNDVIVGSEFDDHIDGGGGDDWICGGDSGEFGDGGNDVIVGGRGDDLIQGWLGDDRLDGGPGRDTVMGGPGNDRVAGGPGQDALTGASGDDVMISNEDSGKQGIDKVDGGGDEFDPGLDICLSGVGDQVVNCEQ